MSADSRAIPGLAAAASDRPSISSAWSAGTWSPWRARSSAVAIDIIAALMTQAKTRAEFPPNPARWTLAIPESTTGPSSGSAAECMSSQRAVPG